MAPSRVVGGLANSSSGSGIFFQVDEQSQAVVNSHLSSSFGNSMNSNQGTGQTSLVPASSDMSNAAFNSVANSGPSVGASSLVTDANSALSGGARLQRSASINTDSYMRLPASPMSFSSNNISISGSSIMDGSSVVQHGSHQDQGSQQQGGSSATSLPTSQIGQCALGSFIQDPNHLSNMQKKPRLDIKQEDLLMQQLLQRQESMQLPGSNPQIQAYIQQQRFRQQQQMLQSMPQIQQAHLQQQQMLLRQQLQQQGMQPMNVIKRPFDSGVCARRLMQYLYHQRQRPADNSIAYWRKFVAEYYSPRAKRRWCLSKYDNVGHHALGVFPQAAMDAWQCDICDSKSGKGFEATYEVLPRLNEIKFSSGVIDELLFVDFSREIRFPSGMMILEYAKAVQESVYEQLRVIREGQLRITFTPDLKILCWEFCAWRHEELLPRRLVAPQVGLVVQAAQKCQSTLMESGSDEVSQQDLQSNSSMVLAACHKLAKNLDLQSLNDLGFSKRYVRCLQISEVVNSMKDLISFCKERKVGPIEGLKSYPRHASTAKLQMQKMQEIEHMAGGLNGLPTDQNTLNKLMALHPGLNNHMSNTRVFNYPNLLRQTSMNSLQHQEASSPFGNTSHQTPPSSSYQGHQQHSSLIQASINGYSSPHPHAQQQQRQQHSLSASCSHPQPSQMMIQQVLQEQSFSGQTVNGPPARNVVGLGSNSTAASPNMPGSVGGPTPSRSNSSKGAANSDSSAAGGTEGFNHKAQDFPSSLKLSDEFVQDIAHEFEDNGFFDGDLDDTMGYSWKG